MHAQFDRVIHALEATLRTVAEHLEILGRDDHPRHHRTRNGGTEAMPSSP